MEQKRAYQYRCYPTKEQQHILARTFGCVRYIYNWALRKRTDAYYQCGERWYYAQMSAALTDLKKQDDHAWLNDVSSVPTQQALRHLDKALTVTKDTAGRYFVSILVEEDFQPLPVTSKIVGLDLGIKSMVITSDGQTYGNPKFFAKDERKLARAQRQHTKKKKGSSNREKARRKVARIHARIADRRRDYQHKLSTHIIRENQVVCVESLTVKYKVKNHSLAKAISDVGWGEFVRQLEYKARWYGRTLVKSDKFYPSSKRCHGCGHLLDSLLLDVRWWNCPECGMSHDRAINAAKNILAAGLAVYACGKAVRPGRVKAQAGASRRSRNASR